MTVDPQYLRDLLRKYGNNSCTKQEFEELLMYIRSGNSDKEFLEIIDEMWDMQQLSGTAYQHDLPHDWTKVMRELHRTKNRHPKRGYTAIIYNKRWQIAAMLLVGISILWAILSYSDYAGKIQHKKESSGKLADNNVKKSNTHLTLSDGSVIVLEPGSELDYPQKFTGNTREVKLVRGEAYFDIKPDPGKPFIIYTGRVKTTVVGTSFSIKVAPNGEVITVTVTKGRVKVEDEQRALADLHSNEQLIYHVTPKIPVTNEVNAKEAIEWIMVDMAFTDIRFDDITKVLEKRYQVQIRFENMWLRAKRITATFDGTESLETVLKILCDTQHAEYSVENGIIYIR
jgi:ferric-dicitrate binding protein FerR (iron transport regulator)